MSKNIAQDPATAAAVLAELPNIRTQIGLGPRLVSENPNTKTSAPRVINGPTGKAFRYKIWNSMNARLVKNPPKIVPAMTRAVLERIFNRSGIHLARNIPKPINGPNKRPLPNIFKIRETLMMVGTLRLINTCKPIARALARAVAR